MSWFKVSRGAGLDRYYLFKLFGWGVFLHHIHHSDPRGVYHSHPWSGLSLFFGSYLEFFHGTSIGKIRIFWNWIDAKKHHRVVIERPMWTLFFHAPKSNQWEVIDEQGRRVESAWEGDVGYKDYSAALDKAAEPKE